MLRALGLAARPQPLRAVVALAVVLVFVSSGALGDAPPPQNDDNSSEYLVMANTKMLAPEFKRVEDDTIDHPRVVVGATVEDEVSYPSIRKVRLVQGMLRAYPRLWSRPKPSSAGNLRAAAANASPGDGSPDLGGRGGGPSKKDEQVGKHYDEQKKKEQEQQNQNQNQNEKQNQKQQGAGEKKAEDEPKGDAKAPPAQQKKSPSAAAPAAAQAKQPAAEAKQPAGEVPPAPGAAGEKEKAEADAPEGEGEFHAMAHTGSSPSYEKAATMLKDAIEGEPFPPTPKNETATGASLSKASKTTNLSSSAIAMLLFVILILGLAAIAKQYKVRRYG